MKIILDYLLVN